MTEARRISPRWSHADTAEQARDTFHGTSCVVLHGVVSRETSADLCTITTHLGAQHRPLRGVHRRDLDVDTERATGRYAHTTIESGALTGSLYALHGIYEALVPLLSFVTGREVIRSPWPRSAVTLKVYGPGDEQGEHTDTNALTAVLHLTDTWDNDTAVVVRDTPICAHPGDLLIMDGKYHPHYVPPVPANRIRVTAVLNYYYPDDCERPEGTDAIVYGS